MANIKYALSSIYNLNHEPLYAQVAWLTRDILDSYDGHWDWLQHKFFPGLKEGKRGYSFAVDYDSTQVITTKKDIISVHEIFQARMDNLNKSIKTIEEENGSCTALRSIQHQIDNFLKTSLC